MKNAFVRTSMIVALAVITAGLASAQDVGPPARRRGTSTLTATVSEQASFSVPSTVNFNVTNIVVTTVASGVSVTATTSCWRTLPRRCTSWSGERGGVHAVCRGDANLGGG